MGIYAKLKLLSSYIEQIYQIPLVQDQFPCLTSYPPEEWWDSIFKADNSIARIHTNHFDVPISYSEKIYLTKEEMKIVRRLRKDTLKALKEKGINYNSSLTDEFQHRKYIGTYSFSGRLTDKIPLKVFCHKIRKYCCQKLLFGRIVSLQEAEGLIYGVIEGRQSKVERVKRYLSKKLEFISTSYIDSAKFSYKSLQYKEFEERGAAMEYFECRGDSKIINALMLKN